MDRLNSVSLPSVPLSETEECCEFEESPGSLQPSETSSNGAVDDSGSLWGSLGPNTLPTVVNTSSCQGPVGLGTGVSNQDSLRRCSQRKKSDMLLLGCASLLASVALGQDLMQLGKLQVRKQQTGQRGRERKLGNIFILENHKRRNQQIDIAPGTVYLQTKFFEVSPILVIATP